jgi:hypothetical protein
MCGQSTVGTPAALLAMRTPRRLPTCGRERALELDDEAAIAILGRQDAVEQRRLDRVLDAAFGAGC